MTQQELLDLLRLSHVPCWVIVPHVRRQSVAEHSFRVIAIAHRLAELISMKPEDKAAVSYICLIHDIEEARSGDIPATWKYREIGGDTRKEPADDVGRVVKLADLMERYTYLNNFMGSGSIAAAALAEVHMRMREFIHAHFPKHEADIWAMVTEITRSGL